MQNTQHNTAEPEIWEIKLITPKGFETITYKPIEKTISQLEHELTEKHGTFIVHSSKLIPKPA